MTRLVSLLAENSRKSRTKVPEIPRYGNNPDTERQENANCVKTDVFCHQSESLVMVRLEMKIDKTMIYMDIFSNDLAWYEYCMYTSEKDFSRTTKGSGTKCVS